MDKLIQSTAALFAILCLASCGGGPSHEEVAADLMDTMEEFVDIIASVKDEASADKAAKDLDKVASKMEKLKAQADKLGDPSADVKAKIEADMKARRQAIQQKMMGSMTTMMANQNLMEKLKPAMDRITKVMQD